MGCYGNFHELCQVPFARYVFDTGFADVGSNAGKDLKNCIVVILVCSRTSSTSR